MSSIPDFNPYLSSYSSYPYKSLHTASPDVTHIPMHGGVSILNVSPINENMGTIGGVVRKGNQNYLISNRHVLADVGPKGDAKGPEEYLRLFKMTKPTNIYALKGTAFARGQVIAKTVPSMQTPNIDVGFAIPTVPVSWEVPGIGVPTGVVDPKVGMRVVKVGARTGQTISQVWWLNLPLGGINGKGYGLGPNSFTAYSGYGRTSDTGDSGCLVFEEGTRKVVGLHFGSDRATGRYTWGYNASMIERQFGVSFTPPGVVRTETTSPTSIAPVPTNKPALPPSTSSIGTGTGVTGNPLLDMINNLIKQLLALIGVK